MCGEEDAIGIIRQHHSTLNRYAGHWEWPCKYLKEKSVAEDFIESYRDATGVALKIVKVLDSGEDPPDVVLIDGQGCHWALELTELVEQKKIVGQRKIDEAARGASVEWAQWDQAKLLDMVCKRIAIKDQKITKMSQNQSKQSYARYLQVLHTDEPQLQSSLVEEALTQVINTNKVDEAFVLLSYDPYTGRYSLARIPVARAPSSAIPALSGRVVGPEKRKC